VKMYYEGLRQVLDDKYKLGVYSDGVICDALLKAGLCDYAWLSASTAFEGSKDFAKSDRGALTQKKVDLDWNGLSVDLNDSKSEFGAFLVNNGAAATSNIATGRVGIGVIVTPDGYAVPAESRHLVADIPFDKAMRVGKSFTDGFEAWDRTPRGRNDPSRCRGLYQLPGGVLFWESKMALDADGSTTRSVLDSSSGSAPETSLMFKRLNGRDAKPVNAEIVPYFVLPQHDFIRNLGIPLGALGVIIYRDKITGAIFADEGPTMKIGEASIRVHELLLDPPAPWKGNPANKILRDVSVESGVLYFVFPNSVFDINAYGPEGQSDMAQAIQTAAMAQFNTLKGVGVA